MGTEIQKFDPKPEDFPDGKDGFNDGLILTKPDWIKKIHRSYLEAGADCIETNSFGSNKLKLDEYGFGDDTIEFNKKIAQLAVEVASEFQCLCHIVWRHLVNCFSSNIFRHSSIRHHKQIVLVLFVKPPNTRRRNSDAK